MAPDDVREVQAAAGAVRPSDREMTPDRLAHLTRLQTEVVRRMSDKYIRGQIEHGGDLFSKPGILEMAIDEAVDQVVYLLTLKEQQDAAKSAKTLYGGGAVR